MDRKIAGGVTLIHAFSPVITGRDALRLNRSLVLGKHAFGDVGSRRASLVSEAGATRMRGVVLLYVAIAVFVTASVLALARWVDPAPPQSVRMATGSPGGAYAAAGAALAERLTLAGVEVELVGTSGSVENVSLLTSLDPSAQVDVAIVQGGVGPDAPRADQVEALGGIFYEPLWVFVRNGVVVEDLRDLEGLRVAGGPLGSGVRALALMLLRENGLDETTVRVAPLGGADAAQALRDGAVDVAVFVTTPDRPYVSELLVADGVSLFKFERAPAYARRHRYLSEIALPRGVVDPAIDSPRADATLIAPAASIVVRKDLHPAIQSELLQGADELFRAGGILAAPGVFPSRDAVAFPLSEEAERFYERGGPSFLRRYLPFWAANLAERLWVLLIPLATLVYPLLKAAPPAYKWRARQRIIRWYKDLRRLETEGRMAPTEAERARVRADLARILSEVGRLKVPLTLTDDLYRLRTHIRWVDQLVSEADLRSGSMDEAA